VERILLAQEKVGIYFNTRAYVAIAKDERRAEAFRIVRALRAAGLDAQMEQAGRSLKGQLKQANRWNAAYAVIVGDELEVKHMDSGEQRVVSDVDELVTLVTS
jgi:histidyl-tRNA synthetase